MTGDQVSIWRRRAPPAHANTLRLHTTGFPLFSSPCTDHIADVLVITPPPASACPQTTASDRSHHTPCRRGEQSIQTANSSSSNNPASSLSSALSIKKDGGGGGGRVVYRLLCRQNFLTAPLCSLLVHNRSHKTIGSDRRDQTAGFLKCMGSLKACFNDVRPEVSIALL